MLLHSSLPFLLHLSLSLIGMLPMADSIGGEVVTELVRQLYAVSQKTLRCRGIARNLATMIEDLQPSIKEIQYSGVELSPHRQAQLRMFSETLEKCRKVTEKVLKSNRWNMVRQLIHVRKMENLESQISSFLNGQLLVHILADIHHVRADSEVRFDRIDSKFDSLNEKLGSMKIRGSESMREVMKMEEATSMEMAIDGGDLGDLGVGLELGKRKVKEMLFKSNDEDRLIGISGMSGSGKTTLAKELARDEQVRGNKFCLAYSCCLIMS